MKSKAGERAKVTSLSFFPSPYEPRCGEVLVQHKDAALVPVQNSFMVVPKYSFENI